MIHRVMVRNCLIGVLSWGALSSLDLKADQGTIRSVLVLYPGTTSSKKISTRASDRRLLEAEILRQTTLAEERVFHGLSRSPEIERKTIWLANATVAKLYESEIDSLKRNPEVADVLDDPSRSWILDQKNSILEKNREAEILPMPREIPPYEFYFSPSARFTYGLEKIRIPAMRFLFPGVDGRGVTVGIIDTGIDPRHPDLVGRTVAFRDFTKNSRPDPYDDQGHGSHVAGTVAGGNSSGKAIGVAPGASLVIGKVFDSKGNANDSDILLAMQWMADPDGDPQTEDAPKLVSNSWANSDAFAGKSPNEFVFCRAVETWASLGIIPVFSAGNEGPGADTVQIPGACPKAIAVGATNDRDGNWNYSSRGQARWREGVVAKPDIVAPGADIESAAPGGGYRTKSGTSMSTPHVAGLVALMLQVRPTMSTEEVRSALMSSSQDLGISGPDAIFGSGRIDARDAIELVTNLN